MFEENLELQKFVVKLLPWTNDVDPSVRMVHILMGVTNWCIGLSTDMLLWQLTLTLTLTLNPNFSILLNNVSFTTGSKHSANDVNF